MRMQIPKRPPLRNPAVLTPTPHAMLEERFPHRAAVPAGVSALQGDTA
jgi:hypothetical protein